jgi:hypothetical protein
MQLKMRITCNYIAVNDTKSNWQFRLTIMSKGEMNVQQNHQCQPRLKPHISSMSALMFLAPRINRLEQRTTWTPQILTVDPREDDDLAQSDDDERQARGVVSHQVQPVRARLSKSTIRILTTGVEACSPVYTLSSQG